MYVLLFCVFPCHHECGILKNITVEWMFYVFNGLRFSFMDFYTYTNKKNVDIYKGQGMIFEIVGIHKGFVFLNDLSAILLACPQLTCFEKTTP